MERAKLHEEEYKEHVGESEKLYQQTVDLFFVLLDLLTSVTKEDDEDIYVMEVILTAARSVFSSTHLYRAGYFKEAHQIIRHTIELMLITIDITCNSKSMNKWRGTMNEDGDAEYEWYFKKQKICSRIKEDGVGTYPDWEKFTALGLGDKKRQGLCQEWKSISNQSVHARSLSQIRKLIGKEGKFAIFSLKSEGEYRKDFFEYANIMFTLCQQLLALKRLWVRIELDPKKSKKNDEVRRNFSFVHANIEKELNEHNAAG